MEAYEKLKELNVDLQDENSRIQIKFNRIVPEFTERDRFLMLYSEIVYQCEDFYWKGIVPTVHIPYKDPAMGFLLNGAISSSIGVYQRAPGAIMAPDRVDIVSMRNSVVSIVNEKDNICICFKRGTTTRHVPIGVFLKAISGLPYSIIKKKFVYWSPKLLYSFPSTLDPDSKKVRKAELAPNDDDVEPSYDDCVAFVYSAIYNIQYVDPVAEAFGAAGRSKYKYSTQWKLNRIRSFLNRLHFKNSRMEEYELGNRAVNCTLTRPVTVPGFKAGKNGSAFPEQDDSLFYLTVNSTINPKIAAEINKYDIPVLYVQKGDKPFALQSEASMNFRAKGYLLAGDVVDPTTNLSLKDMTLIDDEVLEKLNNSSLTSIDVYTPKEKKVIRRTGEEPELGDFINLVNCLITAVNRGIDESQEYNIGNRIIIDYDKQVYAEVEQTYDDIVDSLSKGLDKDGALQFPKLPSDNLRKEIKNRDNKEVTQSELTNVMSRAISQQKASALIGDTPKAMQFIQGGQYGRIDSLHSPESDKIGAVQQLSVMASLDSETGEILTPLEVVENGKPTGVIKQVTVREEANKFIAAWDDELNESITTVRNNDGVTTVETSRVDYRDVSPYQDMSVSRATVPFPEFSMPRRSLMATKMNGQAVPLMFPQRPRVSAGGDTEVPCLYYTGRDIIEFAGLKEKSGEKVKLFDVQWRGSTAEYTVVYGESRFQYSVPFTPTDKETLYCYRVNYKEGYEYSLDDIVFYNQSCDIKDRDQWIRIKEGSQPFIKHQGMPSMALGTNLRVGYKTYGSSTIDDAVVISDRLVRDMTLSSVQIFKYEYDLQGNERIEDVYFPQIHQYFSAREPVLTIVNQNGKSRSVYTKQPGECIRVEKDSARGKASAWLVTYHNAEVGDKVAGRYGNKSVIAKIVPEGQMPYDPETGEILDIICNPLGIPSRMNLGQLLEVALGAVMAKNDKYAVVSPFYPGIKQEVERECEEAGIKPKRLFNPKYGKFTERPVTVGVMYFLKLEQIANLKMSAVGYPKGTDPVFNQPMSTTSGAKGQAISEWETWALMAAGSKKILNGYCTYFADNEEARNEYFKMLAANDETNRHCWDESEDGMETYNPLNKSALVTQTVYRTFGLDIEAEEGSDVYRFKPLEFDDTYRPVKPAAFLGGADAESSEEWCKVKLKADVINPFWIETFPLGKLIGQPRLKSLANRKAYYNVHTHQILSPKQANECETSALITGMEAVLKIIRNTKVSDCLRNLLGEEGNGNPGQVEEVDDSEETEVFTGVVVGENGEALSEEDEAMKDIMETLGFSYLSDDKNSFVEFLRNLQADGKELSCLIWSDLPILPKVFRQSSMSNGRAATEHSFQKQLKAIVNASTSQEIYDGLKRYIGYTKETDSSLTSFRRYFFGKGAGQGEHGKVRSAVLSKHIGFSGRSVIIPSQDITMSPYFVGIPWNIAMVELGSVMAIRLKGDMKAFCEDLMQDDQCFPVDRIMALSQEKLTRIIESLGDFNPKIMDRNIEPNLTSSEKVTLYDCLRYRIRRYCERNVRPDGTVFHNGQWMCPEDIKDGETLDVACVTVGRQPTLHKKSLRAFFMKLVDGYTTQMHPVVCNGFNADFDGDTMWDAQLFGDMKVEAWKTISVLQDLVSEKDGSYTLMLAQDSALGLYGMTTFENNVAKPEYRKDDFYFADDLEKLRDQVEYGDIHYYDPIVYKCPKNGKFYCSTAGRILVNGAVPGAMTEIVADDPDGIIEQVFGKEAVGKFCRMLYDNVWSGTNNTPKGRKQACNISNILLETYKSFGARPSVDTTQRLFELGVTASDIISVSMGMEDMSVDLDIDRFLQEPQQSVQDLNTLYQMGLVSDEERKNSSAAIWRDAKKDATAEVLNALAPTSNMFYCLFSGARGKADQLMQAVGFLGIIQKDRENDIEYPILRSYGQGLSSIDLAQTRYSARMGVISTQSGTKETGYATRQSIYMTAGLETVGESCGIEVHSQRVRYSEEASIKRPDGSEGSIDELKGELVDPKSESYDLLRKELDRSGFVINEAVLDAINERKPKTITLLDKGDVTFRWKLDEQWKEMAKEHYSYALPFTDGMKITDRSLQWVEDMGLNEIIMFDEDEMRTGTCFDREAYLPCDYERSSYTMYYGHTKIDDAVAMVRSVAEDSPKRKLYERLLDEKGRLTPKALKYLTKKEVRQVKYQDGSVLTIKYNLTKLFSQLIVGRVAVGLPYLDSDSCITEKTVKAIQEYQLRNIAVYTSLTCLAHRGICVKCAGKSPSTGRFYREGENLGIAASQAMGEPLSQATLNVTHSGGNRSSGTGLVSGLSYYQQLLNGRTVSKKTERELEVFAPFSGYVSVQKGTSSVVVLTSDEPEDEAEVNVDGEGKTKAKKFAYECYGIQEPVVPDGAYVEEGDTIISGYTDLDRFDSTDVFQAALRTRYQLIKEQQKVFSSLSVAPRNYEIMSRAQTSNCYRCKGVSGERVKDVSDEAEDRTGDYMLRVSRQSETVQTYSGLACYGFENVGQMLVSNICAGKVQSNSWLSNIISGTVIGDKEAKMISRKDSQYAMTHSRSQLDRAREHVSCVNQDKGFLQLNGVADPEADLSSVKFTPLDYNAGFAILEAEKQQRLEGGSSSIVLQPLSFEESGKNDTLGIEGGAEETRAPRAPDLAPWELPGKVMNEPEKPKGLGDVVEAEIIEIEPEKPKRLSFSDFEVYEATIVEDKEEGEVEDDSEGPKSEHQMLNRLTFEDE